ncbi:hypothetical protein TWF694_002844 [Orbilia ellipsospora]|uniref:CBM1 domain-containing protein n=1 Tax=Orbilia ellipsospora TaxID=2528407 RepID=A0AAV9X5W9_9PEZI
MAPIQTILTILILPLALVDAAKHKTTLKKTTTKTTTKSTTKPPTTPYIIITTTTTAAIATTTAASTTRDERLQVLYGQCGIVAWNGPTLCSSPYTCVTLNPYIAQCL